MALISVFLSSKKNSKYLLGLEELNSLDTKDLTAVKTILTTDNISLTDKTNVIDKGRQSST